jgi:hypothetical protein
MTVQNPSRLIKAPLEVDVADDEITYFKKVHQFHLLDVLIKNVDTVAHM